MTLLIAYVETNPIHLALWFSGSAFVGAMVGGAISFWWEARKRKRPTPHEALSSEVQRDVEVASESTAATCRKWNARSRLTSAARDVGLSASMFEGPGRWAALAEATRKANARRGR